MRLNLDSGGSREVSDTVEDLASRFETVAVRETDLVDGNNDNSLFDELLDLDGDESLAD